MNKSGGTGDCYRTPAYRQPNTTSGVSDIPEIVCQTNCRTARRLNGFFETAYRNPGESITFCDDSESTDCGPPYLNPEWSARESSS